MNPVIKNTSPSVLVFSSYSGLSISIVEELVARKCSVVVLTENSEPWKNILKSIPDLSEVSVIDLTKESSENISANYIVYVSDLIEPNDSPSQIEENKKIFATVSSARQLSSPTLLILPYTYFSEGSFETANLSESLVQQNKDILGAIFVGDVLGGRVLLGEGRPHLKMIKEALLASHIQIPKSDFEIFPVYIPRATAEIIRSLFSFGGIGESVAVISHPVKPSHFYQTIKRHRASVGGAEVLDNTQYFEFSKLSDKKYLEVNLDHAIGETLVWNTPQRPALLHQPETALSGLSSQISSLNLSTLSRSDTKEKQLRPDQKGITPKLHQDEVYESYFKNLFPTATREKSQPKPKGFPLVKKISGSPILKRDFSKKVGGKFPKHFFHFTKRRFVAAAFALLLIFAFPYFLIALGYGAAYLASRSVSSGEVDRASKEIAVAKSFFKLADSEFGLLVEIPVIGDLFVNSRKVSSTSLKISTVALKAYKVSSQGAIIFGKALGKESYDLTSYANQIALELGLLYQDLSFLEGDLVASDGVIRYAKDKIFSSVDLKSARQKVRYLELAARELPDVLGMDSKKTYVILFQNNMELRPTGGFIGSFATISFDKGRLIDLNVSDVYTADGQLKGFVEPPAPIVNYLGEASWFLRDSNWDPNFVSSAAQAEWFLDKEVDLKVDGVVGIDLAVAKDLIGILGGVKLTEFGVDITANNFYEITQVEVEKDFFPGSRKKSNFLTALTSELLVRGTALTSKDYFKVAGSTLKNLEERHIQVYIHNSELRRAVAEAGWDGNIDIPGCQGNCFSDYVGMVEANVGVNKANYFVTRAITVNTKLSVDTVSKTVTLALQNSADAVLGAGARYKTYLRLLVPTGTEASAVEVIEEGRSSFVTPETFDIKGRRELGILVEVYPGTKTSVVFRLQNKASLDFENPGEYNIAVRKQAGTDSDPLNVTISPPLTLLTNSPSSSYNTTLVRDFTARLGW